MPNEDGVAFTIEFQLGQAEQFRASRVMSHRRLSTRLAYLCFLLLPVAMAGEKAYRGSLARRGWSSETGLVVISLFALLCCALVYVAPYFSVQTIRKKNRAASGPHRYVLDSTGVDASAPGVRTSIQWQNVIEAYESAEFLFLYVSANYAVLVPKRVVGSSDLAALRRAVREWVGDRAKLLDVRSTEALR